MDAHDKLARLFGLIAVRAGRAIMRMRETGTSAQYKGDGSPVTAADLAADEIIRHCLERNVPEYPVITEETCTSRALVDAERFILVDPLDGTKEFIQGTPEFTVNIALIEHGKPVAGAVYAPALRRLYIGHLEGRSPAVLTKDPPKLQMLNRARMGSLCRVLATRSAAWVLRALPRTELGKNHDGSKALPARA